MLCALIVNEKLNAALLHHLVAGLFLIQRHLVMQSRATALSDLHAQTFAPATAGLFFEQAAKLSRRVLGDVNHGSVKLRFGSIKSTAVPSVGDDVVVLWTGEANGFPLQLFSL